MVVGGFMTMIFLIDASSKLQDSTIAPSDQAIALLNFVLADSPFPWIAWVTKQDKD
jgi:hypothetical protein